MSEHEVEIDIDDPSAIFAETMGEARISEHVLASLPDGGASLSAAIKAAARADLAAVVEDDVDGRTAGPISEPEAGRFTTTRHFFLIS